ncbi:MAG: hypothetical protein V1647_03265 [Pseudomonadota bacterium]
MKKVFTVFAISILLGACSGSNRSGLPGEGQGFADCAKIDETSSNIILTLNSLNIPDPYVPGMYCNFLTEVITAQDFVDESGENSCAKITDLKTAIDAVKDKMARVVDNELPFLSFCQPTLAQSEKVNLLDILIPRAEAYTTPPNNTCAESISAPPFFQGKTVYSVYNSKFICLSNGVSDASSKKYFSQTFSDYLVHVYATGTYKATKTEPEVAAAILDVLNNNNATATVGSVIH